MNISSTLQYPTSTPVAQDAIPAFCETCKLLQCCANRDTDAARHSGGPGIGEVRGPYRPGDYLFGRGDPFDALFVLRSGAVKLRTFAEGRRERVGAFYLPGDVIGLRSAYDSHFRYDAVALDTTFACYYPFQDVCSVTLGHPALQQHLLRALAAELRWAHCLGAEQTADARMAAFLVRIGECYGRCGHPPTAFHLPMSRQDIGSYLRLATETVTRVLTRFARRRWIAVHTRDVELLNLERLRRTGKPLLAY